jgi:hypothetical protein
LIINYKPISNPVTLPISIFELNKRQHDPPSESPAEEETPLDREATPDAETASEAAPGSPVEEIKDDEPPVEGDEKVAPVEAAAPLDLMEEAGETVEAMDEGDALDLDLDMTALDELDEEDNDLLDLLDDVAMPSDQEAQEGEAVSEGQLDLPSMEAEDEDIVQLMEEAVEAPPEPPPLATAEDSEDIPMATAASLSPEQLEAALERLVDKQLGEENNRLLTAAIEKAVTEEMDRLRRLFAGNPV